MIVLTIPQDVVSWRVHICNVTKHRPRPPKELNSLHMTDMRTLGSHTSNEFQIEKSRIDASVQQLYRRQVTSLCLFVPEARRSRPWWMQLYRYICCFMQSTYLHALCAVARPIDLSCAKVPFSCTSWKCSPLSHGGSRRLTNSMPSAGPDGKTATVSDLREPSSRLGSGRLPGSAAPQEGMPGLLWAFDRNAWPGGELNRLNQ